MTLYFSLIFTFYSLPGKILIPCPILLTFTKFQMNFEGQLAGSGCLVGSLGQDTKPFLPEIPPINPRKK
jgi:hypothetical protein